MSNKQRRDWLADLVMRGVDWSGEWTLPAPGMFNYLMMMGRERIRRFQVKITAPLTEAAIEMFRRLR